MEYNPYDILGVSQGASKAEITKAVAVAMKRKQYPVDVIAKAQKSLMKPEERIIADYLRPVLPPIQRFKYSDLSALAESAPTLVMLPQFDGLEKAIAQSTQEEQRERELRQKLNNEFSSFVKKVEDLVMLPLALYSSYHDHLLTNICMYVRI